MLTFHAVEIDRELTRADPLYVGHFFDLRGMWWTKRRQRQGLILSIAAAWHNMVQRNPLSPGFVEEEVLVTSLTRQVHDAKVILERFFKITRRGFNFGDGNKSPTRVTPRRLSKRMIAAIDAVVNEVRFSPGLPPLKPNLVKSEVRIQPERSSFVLAELRRLKRDDLIPPVTWLYKQDSPLTFYYERAGNLGLRDKSVWPIKAIETWPGWLRAELFGTVVDIENAYVQFVLIKLRELFDARKLQMMFPDLIRADERKQEFREDLCRSILHLEPTDENIGIVKRLIMALANGSNASPLMMTSTSTRSEAVRIVRQANPELSPSDLIAAGTRLQFIAKQFASAKRQLCLHLLNAKPSRANQKKIFTLYFAWEREARYAIWEACGRTGLHLHDGIDGVQTNIQADELAHRIAQKTSIRVSVDKPNACAGI